MSKHEEKQLLLAIEAKLKEADKLADKLVDAQPDAAIKYVRRVAKLKKRISKGYCLPRLLKQMLE